MMMKRKVGLIKAMGQGCMMVWLLSTTTANAASHVWTNLGSGVDGTVNALVHAGANLYVAGDFFSAGGVAASKIAMWNGFSWTNLGDGLNDTVNALAHDGTNLYAGGMFSTADGRTANYIAKWNGSNWTNLGEGLNERVFALVHDGVNLYAGGLFTTAGVAAASFVAKWNGSSWTNLDSGIVGGYGVNALAHDGANLYAAGGYITNAGGVTINNIAKWNGSSWTNLGSGVDGFVVFALAHDGMNLYTGGWITNAGGVAVNSIAQWNGSSWTNLGSGVNGMVNTLMRDGSYLYVGGSFSEAGGIAANNMAMWNGSVWTNLSDGLNGGVNALAKDLTQLYAGGMFTEAGGTPANNVALFGKFDQPLSTNDFICVSTNGNDSANGFSWATAKRTIQAGVDAAGVGKTVMVSNGVYDTGGGIGEVASSVNRVYITKGITVCSVNGPEYTIIDGANSMRVVYMTNGTHLTGFTITGGNALYTAGILGTNATVSNCIIRNNRTVWYGGGARGVTLNNCIIRDNTLTQSAGGAAQLCTLNNCLLVGNYAGTRGGGTYRCTLNNCTVSRNRHYDDTHGSVCESSLNNCIVWDNSGIRQITDSTARNTCAPNGLTHGVDGCITNNPLFLDGAVSNFSLQALSPCIDTGNNVYAPTNVSPNDLAGHPRIVNGIVDMGAYEFSAIYVTTNGSDSADGFTWATAKRTIQAAVDAAGIRKMVVVSNGVYNTGGGIVMGDNAANRVCITNGIMVCSVNGPEYTTIQGTNNMRVVFMANGTRLAGFTVTGGHADNTGGILGENATVSSCMIRKNTADYVGGAYGVTLNNCIIRENESQIGPAGGADSCTLNNCLLVGNYVFDGAGAAFRSQLNNCTISKNRSYLANAGSTLFKCSVSNCIVWGNFQNDSFFASTVRNTCAQNGVTHGVNGCITNNPMFLDEATSNFTLQVLSPCIDRGINAAAPTNASLYDLAGNPRVVNAVVDMGAYEFQEANNFFIAQNGQTPQAPYTNWSTASSNFLDAITTADYPARTGYRRAIYIGSGLYSEFFGIVVGPEAFMGSTMLYPYGVVYAPATALIATNATFVNIAGTRSSLMYFMFADMTMPRPSNAGQTAGLRVDGCQAQFNGAARFQTNAAVSGGAGQRKLVVSNCGKLIAKTFTNQWALSLQGNGLVHWIVNTNAGGGGQARQSMNKLATATAEQQSGALWVNGYADFEEGLLEASVDESGANHLQLSNAVNLAEGTTLGLMAQRVSGNIKVNGLASGLVKALINSLMGADENNWSAGLSGSIADGVILGGAQIDVLGGIELSGDALLDAQLAGSGSNTVSGGGLKTTTVDISRLTMAPTSTVSIASNTDGRIFLSMGETTTFTGRMQEAHDTRNGTNVVLYQHRYQVTQGGGTLAVRCGNAALQADIGVIITGIVMDVERDLNSGLTESRAKIQLLDGSSMEVYRDKSGALVPTFTSGSNANVVVDTQVVDGVTHYVVRDITPVFSSEEKTSGGTEGVVLRWSSFTNRFYTVHYSTNLLSGFMVLQSNIPATPAVNVYTDSTMTVPGKAYKITTEK
jgi:hypothetical protein